MPTADQDLGAWVESGVDDMLSVLIPAHNEQGYLAQTIAGLVEILDREHVNYEILVINDSSWDGTEKILRKLVNDRIRYVNNEPPNGYGYAVRLGLTVFRGACVAIVMADGSDDPEDLVRFYKKWTEGYDCVFGTRFSQTSRIVDYPWPKRCLNRLGNQIIRALFLIRYNDTTNAFKLYGRHVIAGVYPLTAHGFNLTVELPLKAINRGYTFSVLPNNWYNRKKDISKFKIDEAIVGYFSIIFTCWRDKHFNQRT